MSPPAVRSYEVPGSAEPGYSAIIRSLQQKDGPFAAEPREVRTVYDLFQYAVALRGDRPMVGRRQFDPATRTFGAYEWMTGAQVAEAVGEFASGLDQVYEAHITAPKAGPDDGPFAHQQAVGIYSINRAEWLLAEFAGHRMARHSVALYDTLGADAVEYVLRHAQIGVVVCSIDKVPRLLRLAGRLPLLRAIVCMDSLTEGGTTPTALPFTAAAVGVLREWAAAARISLLDVDQVRAMGRAQPRAARPPRPEDLSTICYTSGTTGNPKGVMATHASYAYSAKAHRATVDFVDAVHLSYLPLAHCYERNVVYSGMLAGGSLGFYSGDFLSLLDDMQALRPTSLLGVPRVFNRIYERIAAATVHAPGLRGAVARLALRQKMAQLAAGGGVHHALWDRTVCRKIRAALGGRLELGASGSAPLDGHVLSFLRAALAVPLREGYGSTECNAAATVTVLEENTAGHVGAPCPGVDIRLRDVPDMGYRATDRPCPRGEITVRGPHTFVGYYRDPAQTRDAYEGDWLLTGDIGIIRPDGNLQIIDRRKNIVKLAQGEFVALEGLETVYS
ncbi:medium-chain fatty acid-CoA ligase faa2, partial [Coemansia nantahalensis]